MEVHEGDARGAAKKVLGLPEVEDARKRLAI
jgi:hypothetical protein